MEQVSDGWIADQYKQTSSAVDVSIQLNITNPFFDRYYDTCTATPTPNAMSDLSTIFGGAPAVHYANLEPNFWLLDGSVQIAGTDSKYEGCCYDFESGADCSVASNKLTFKLGEVYPDQIDTFSIGWGVSCDEFPQKFTLTFYNGASVVKSYSVTNNLTAETEVPVAVSNFDSVAIEVQEWCLPFRHPRIEYVVVGRIRRFDRSEILSIDHKKTCDPLSLKVPSETFTFKVDNTGEIWNTENPNSLAPYLEQGQTILVRYGLRLNDNGTEWISGCRVFLSDWTCGVGALEASFTGKDVLTFMDDQYFRWELGDMEVDKRRLPNLPTWLQLADYALADARSHNARGMLSWSLDPILASYKMQSWLSSVQTHKALCQLICNAALGVSMRIDRNGKIVLGAPNGEATDYVVSSGGTDFVNCWNYPKVSLRDTNKVVRVASSGMCTSFDEAQADAKAYTDSKGVIIASGSTVHIEQTFKCAALYYGEGGTTNPLVINQPAKGSATATNVRVHPYGVEFDLTATGTDSQTPITWYVMGTSAKEITSPTAYETPNKSGGIVSVSNPMMSTLSNAADFSSYLAACKSVGEETDEYYAAKYDLEIDWRADPRLDTSDTIPVTTRTQADGKSYLNTYMTYITEIQYKFSGGAMHGKAKGYAKDFTQKVVENG